MATVLVNGAHAVTTNRMKGSGTEPLYIGWGTSSTAATTADTGLNAEKAADISATSGTRVTGTSSRTTTTNTNDTYRVTGTYTATGAGTIAEAGTFDNATIGSGNLYVHGNFTGIPLASGDSITFTIDVKFS